MIRYPKWIFTKVVFFPQLTYKIESDLVDANNNNLLMPSLSKKEFVKASTYLFSVSPHSIIQLNITFLIYICHCGGWVP